MALCRCLAYHAWPVGRGNNEYVGYVLPQEYPRADIVCGRCDEPAVIWLLPEEADAYEIGQRIFDGPNNFVRVRAGDQGVNLGL